MHFETELCIQVHSKCIEGLSATIQLSAKLSAKFILVAGQYKDMQTNNNNTRKSNRAAGSEVQKSPICIFRLQLKQTLH